MQIAPVWRAERPPKGRYRQFVQCDIDIIGDSSQLAEVELITATSDALSTLGLTNCTIRINDRRILTGILDYCGFSEERIPSALISLDKLDKIGTTGVVTELSEAGADAASVLGGLLEKIEPHLAAGGVPLTTKDILRVLPDGIDPDAVGALETLAQSLSSLPEGVQVRFDPTLVRGMGYYTGTIFEISHPESGSSIGGGGRYDGMIGRFLGQDVPAVGFSIGFERIIDLIDMNRDNNADSVVLVHDALLTSSELSVHTLLEFKSQLISQGKRVRLEKRVKNLTPVLDRARDAGFTSFAFVSADMKSVNDLSFKDLA
jgi:histidyl-tRNA synthetase